MRPGALLRRCTCACCLVAALALGACGSGETEGGAAGTFDWSGDVLAADFTGIGAPTVIERDVRYDLRLGTGRVTWVSDWQGCCTDYERNVTIQGGTDTQERRYALLLYEDTLSLTAELVAFRDGAAAPPARVSASRAP